MSDTHMQTPVFKRPAKGLGRLIAHCLGPLPEQIPDLRKNNTDEAWTAAQKPNSWVVGMIVAGVATTAALLLKLLPWSQQSAASLLLKALPIGETVEELLLLLFTLGFLGFIFWIFLRKPSSTGRAGGFLDAALFEELWFRSGCEQWTWGQRIYSCVAFGCIHFTNVVIPLNACAALMLGGMSFMAAYLREYGRTESVIVATRTSAWFHARYNEMVITVGMPLYLVLILLLSSL